MVRVIVAVTACLLLTTTVALADSDLPAKMPGEWTMVSGVEDGKALSEDHVEKARLTLTEDSYAITGGVGTGVKGAYKLDATKSPCEIDSTGDDGTTWHGIVKIEGDTQTIALAPPGKPRPTAFASPAGSGIIFHVWKKKERSPGDR
jgi:uncharacterized protein (TIGR03067 family)